MNDIKRQAESVEERMHKAIKVMCTGERDVRSRLVDAIHLLLPLRIEDFPVHLRDDFKWIRNESTKYPSAQKDIGDIEATMKKIKNKTGQKIANKLFDLYWDLQKIRGKPSL